MPLVEEQIVEKLAGQIATEVSCPVEYEGANVLIDDTTPEWVSVQADIPNFVEEFQQCVIYLMRVRIIGVVREALVPDAKKAARRLRAQCIAAIYRDDRQLEGLAWDVGEASEAEQESVEQENADPAQAFVVTAQVRFGCLPGDLMTAAGG